MKKILLLLLLVIVTGCGAQTNLYDQNKAVIDSAQWQKCRDQKTGAEMNLIDAVTLADKAGCFNGRRLTKVFCGTDFSGRYRLYAELVPPVTDCATIASCSVDVVTGEVEKMPVSYHCFDPGGITEIPPDNTYPSDRIEKLDYSHLDTGNK